MKEILDIQRIRADAVKLTPLCAAGDEPLVRQMYMAYVRAEKEKVRWFAFDLANLNSFSADFVVLLLELTARARRRGGDAALLNIRTSALEDLLTFNAKKYLKVMRSPSEASASTIGDRPSEETAPTASPQGGWNKNITRIELPYDEESIYLATDLVTREAELLGFPLTEISRIKIATYEACLNAIQHARTARAQSKIVVEVERLMNALQIRVVDFGRGFQMREARPFDVAEAAQKGRTGGMGLHIIRRAMDIVDYQLDHLNGNTLQMTKYLRKA